MKKFSILLLSCIWLSISSPAQDHDHEHDHTSGHVHHHIWELGGALGAVYNIGEEHTATGLHMHLLRNFGDDKKIGLGLGFETIFDEHRHLNFGIPVNYNTHRGISLTFTPGVLFMKHEGWEYSPSLHLETLYEFYLDKVHLGPMLEFALAREDLHLMLGIHIGFGW